MNRCPITYEPIASGRYTLKGLSLLSRNLKELQAFPYSAQEQRIQAAQLMKRMSIQGVQPKLSAVLNVRKSNFEIVTLNGRYIIKPQSDIYPHLPENEDLSMRLARIVGIEVPLHGLLYCSDGSMSYFIKRFDRMGRKGRLALEDFTQLSGHSRDTKYDYTIEKMIRIIDTHCTFPVLEKYKFFRMVLFCFLSGNEDMHLKNFSLITRESKVEFSPAYDLVNSTIALGGTEEEMALMLAGRRKEFRRRELIDYLGKEKLALTDVAIDKVIQGFKDAYPQWLALIDISFLSPELKQAYKDILQERFHRLQF